MPDECKNCEDLETRIEKLETELNDAKAESEEAYSVLSFVEDAIRTGDIDGALQQLGKV